jgi:hypothetical protein
VDIMMGKMRSPFFSFSSSIERSLSAALPATA